MNHDQLTNNSPQYITRKDLEEFGMELADIILNGVQAMFDQQNKENDQRFTKIEDNVSSLDRRQDRMEEMIFDIRENLQKNYLTKPEVEAIIDQRCSLSS